MPLQRQTQSTAPGGHASSPGTSLHELTCRLWAPLPIAEVYRALEDPRNLARITPPWLRFEIRSDDAIEMRLGLHIDYTIHWNGLPMGWTSIISAYDPPHSFVDEQVRGPYSYWHHYHGFEPHDNGTLISDRVRYSLPLGPLGRIAHTIMVRRQLLRIFEYRQKSIAELLGVTCESVDEPRIAPAR